ncbi:RELT-like protein 2 [Embiotoca jacksoni]|uniref:RELT-like protein 2 n=1 Tax=Embiotoca jacksoni TaxID=100190 RepID=UPI003704296D
MTELEDPGMEEHTPSYTIFLVVFLFFLTGLLGFLICHLLKKKGYRCRTADMDDKEEEEEEEEKLEGHADDEDEDNQDTVEQILKCIIENEANMEAFNEMLGNHKVCVRHDPRLRKESIGGIPPHHHTVHSGTDHNSCHLCAQVRSKKGRRQSRTPRSKQRPGEQTVFSVGRFRVTHTDKKLHGGPNPLAISGDQLDQSQDSEEQKESGYNLRSMFKEVPPHSESANGVAASVGKRRKSVTIFGLRRSSDPVGIKVGESTGKETGGVKFAIQQQPVVLEEPVQAVGVDSTKPGSKRETKPASPQRETKISGSVNSPSSLSKKQAYNSRSGPEVGSTRSIAASAPSSLPIPSKKRGDVEDKVFKAEEMYDTLPLQTSTPITPMAGSIPGFTPVIPTSQPEPFSSPAFAVTQSPPDPSSSPDLEPGFGANLALISLGSSPPSSFPIRTTSSVSSLKSPTSSMAITPSPKLSSRNMESEAFSPALTPSPKLPLNRETAPFSSSSFGQSVSPLQTRSLSPGLNARPKLESMSVSPQTPSSSPAEKNLSFTSSPHLILKSERVTIKGVIVSSSLFPKEQELEGDTTPKIEEKTEIKRTGILKTAQLSPVAAGDFSPTDPLFKDRLSSFPLSPTSPQSPSSPQGSAVSNVTIVKASPDSKREFSVVTMVEEVKFSVSIKSQKGETFELGVETEKRGISPVFDQGANVSDSRGGQPKSPIGETSGLEARTALSQEKDDMMEMEDITDCKVMQVEGAERMEDEVEKVVHTQSQQD